MDRITKLRIFTRLAETLSFSGTAQSLEIARSSVTKAVNELEVELGVRLLDRTTRSVALTLDGGAFLDRCVTVLDTFDDAHLMFADEASHLRGRVRASVPSRIGRRVIAPVLPEFLERHADVRVDLYASDRQADLVREGFDCALRVGEQNDSELISRKIADVRLITCASPRYLDRYGMPQSIEQLGDHLAVGYMSPFTGSLETLDFEIGDETVRVRIPTRATASDAEMYIACCEAGLGLIQVPAFDVDDALGSGRLVEVLADLPKTTMPMAIVYAHRRNLTPRVKALVEWMSERVREAMGDSGRARGRRKRAGAT